jgi:hypothetical protein
MHKGTYSRYLSDGSDNPAFKNTVSMLSLLLGDETQPKADRDYAAEILAWAVEKDKTTPELAFWTDLDLTMLWEHPSRWKIQLVVEKNGQEKRDCVCDQARLNADCPITPSRWDAPAKAAIPSVAQVESGESEI